MKNINSEFNFEYLNNKKFFPIYRELMKSIYLYNISPDMFCIQFRKILEVIIKCILEVMKLSDIYKNVSMHDKIKILEMKIPKELVDTINIFQEMHNIRIIGNKYVHSNEYNEKIIKKDAYTVLVAMQKICTWFVVFEENYTKWQEKKNSKKESKTSIKTHKVYDFKDTLEVNNSEQNNDSFIGKIKEFISEVFK